MTSIEWLENELIEKKIVRKDNLSTYHDFPTTFELLFMEAKRLHKQEIIDAFDEGQEYEYQYHINNTPKFDSETYYTETFGSKGSDDHISDISKMVEDDVEKLAENNDWEEHIWDDDVNKIAENVFPYDTHRTDYATEECRRIFILGFEKAKQNLYTEEQLLDALKYWSDLLDIDYPKREQINKIIQSLKQHKKD